MPPKRKAAKKGKGQPAAKRQRKQDDPVWLTESEQSPLVYEDLVAQYSNPETYKDWTKEDWEEARQCMPDDAPYNEDGYSVPMEYFKYNVDWRRYVREFQEDLGAGRLDPEWQRQAHQAMKERARGDFDQYKADQFEEFWGQKQKTHSREIAGESAKIKLEELIKGGLFRKGDIFSFQRVFGKSKDRLMVEKDARIMDMDDWRITVGVPPGQLKYARSLPTPDATPEKNVAEKPAAEGADDIGSQNAQSELPEPAQDPLMENSGTKSPQLPLPSSTGHEDTEQVGQINKGEANGTAENTPNEGVPEEPLPPATVQSSEVNEAQEDTPGEGLPTEPPPATVDSKLNGIIQQPQKIVEAPEKNDPGFPSSETAAADVCSNGEGSKLQDDLASSVKAASNAATTPPPPTDSAISSTTNSNETTKPPPTTTPDKPVEDVILVTFHTLSDLERQMVKIDGRVPMQGFRPVNSWKAIRAHRDNQDMGSLFDMRERYYVEQSPTIVKEPQPQRTRKGGREARASRRGS